jgi:hypothetical protein
MAWTLKERPTTRKVTKALAREYRDMDPAPHDRPLSKRRLDVYRAMVERDLFRPVTWAKAFCRETGGTYRVNGKHTSHLFADLDPLPELYVLEETYECETLEDVAKLYATFDSRMQSRNTSDINMSFAATVPALAGFSQKTINTAVAGMTYHLDPSEPWRKQPAERAETLLEYADFVVWLNDLFLRGEEGELSGKHIRRQPVAAAMFGCWLKAKGPATEFWTAVRDETNPDPSSPSRKLARYLHQTIMKGGSSSPNALVKSATAREFYVRSLHAWNAWRKGEPTALRYYADAPLPKIA